jgi:glycosyltransferase involved in cell wall biosynthesis
MGGSEAFAQVITSLDMLVVLSSEPQDREQLQAAMAAGVLLATATKRGLPRELVHEKTGLRFPSDDPSVLMRPLSAFVKNRELSSRLAREGQVAVLGKYSVQAMARRLIKEYERIARRKGVSLDRTPVSEETV